MEYTTYENRRNNQITIHMNNCDQIKKKGGVGEGTYHNHETLEDAIAYANWTGLRVRHCSFCMQ
jgi:hypothetical protein